MLNDDRNHTDQSFSNVEKIAEEKEKLREKTGDY